MPGFYYPERLPVVLSEQEVFSLIDAMTGPSQLIAQLLYGTGMRGSECLRLRVKDIDFMGNEITVQNQNELSLRFVGLPSILRDPLISQIKYVKRLYENDLRKGFGSVHPPIENSGAHTSYVESEFIRQYVFPSNKFTTQPGKPSRRHFQLNSLNDAIRKAADITGINKPASSYVLRHSFAVQMLEDGCDIRTVQELLGHRDIKNTLVYTHFLTNNVCRVRSPLDKQYGFKELQN